MKNIPGPIENARVLFQQDILGFLKRTHEKYNGIAYSVNEGKTTVYISDPKLIRYVLQTNQKQYVKSDSYKVLKIVLGNGLLTSEGDLWKSQRKLIQPSFHKQTILNLFDTMLGCANEMIDEWNEKIKKNNVLDLSEEMMVITLQIIGKTMLSTDTKTDSKSVGDSISNLQELAIKKITNENKIPIWIPTPAHLKGAYSAISLNYLIYKLIKDRKKSKEKKGDLLDMLMESRYEDTGKKMPVKLLVNELLTIFSAGHETTANALTWTFYLISQHPEVYKKLKKEIDEVVGKGEMTFQHFQQLKYTKDCFNESMRLYPPAWGIGRKAAEDNMVGDYLIKKDTDVSISIYNIHRNPEYWKNPDTFDPDRWETEEVKQMDKFAYFPFGAGPRMCVGNNFALFEADIIITKVIQHFSFEYLGQIPPVMEPLITLRPKNGMPMKVKKVVD